MANANIPENLDPIKVAYFAGLFDAEGWCGIPGRQYANGNYYAYPKLSVGMTDKFIIVATKEFFGCGNIQSQTPDDTRKRAYHWSTSNRDTAFVARTIRPFSITKREKLDLILAHYNMAYDHIVMNDELRNAYFAGLLDGDGHVTITKSYKTGLLTQPLIVLVMTHEETVNAFHEYFGVGSMCTNKSDNPNWKRHWRCTVWHNGARKIAAAVAPYSLLKHEVFEKIIALPTAKRQRDKINGRYV